MDSINKNMTEMIQQSALSIAKQTKKQKNPNISSPTRALMKKRREMIENETPRDHIIKNLSVVDGVADHNTILIDINISPKRKCPLNAIFFIRNKADNASILKHLDNCKDEYFMLNDNTTVNEKWNIVASEVTNIINKYVPHFFASSRHNLPWFTKILKLNFIKYPAIHTHYS